MMIKWAIKLKDALDSNYYKITILTHEEYQNYFLDEITLDDLETLIKIISIMKFLYSTTKYLESYATKWSHCVL